MAENFTPGETIPLTATAAGASASFSLAQSANYPDVMVTNTGGGTAFLGFGGAASLPGAGVANATPIMAGETLVFRKGSGTTLCSAITASGTATLYFTAGQGA